MTGARDKLLGGDVELLVRVMRVRADGAKNFGKALGDGEHLVMAADTGRNRDKPLQAGSFGAGHNGVELASKVVKV